MTESQLYLFAPFTQLPIYDESDARAAAVARPNGSVYIAVRECCTVQEVADCLKNPRLTPLGALRGGKPGQQVVVAYFGESPG